MKKYINKKCKWCQGDDWYDGENRITKVCSFHQKYSLKRCLKEIKIHKWDQWEIRICFGMILLLLIILIFSGVIISKFGEIEAPIKILSGVVLFVFVGLFIYLTKELIDSEKRYKQRLKELRDEMNEWEEIK